MIKKKQQAKAEIGKRLPPITISEDPHYAAEVDELRGMISTYEDRAWTIGEKVMQLREWSQENYGKPLSFAQLAADLAIQKVKGNYLNRLYLTAKMFPQERRSLQPDWNWYDFDKLRHAQLRLTKGKSASAEDRTAIEDELDEILATHPKSARQFSNFQATAQAAKNKIRTRKEVEERKAKYEGDTLKIVNHCHLKDWQEIIASLPLAALDGMIADPPFARLGSYYSAKENPMSCLGSKCANATPQEALATTLPLFDHADKFLPHGFILLFSEGGLPLDSRILARAKGQGWNAYREIHLIKVDDAGEIDDLNERQVCTPSPSFMDEPFAPVEIKLTLFYREGYKPKRIGTRSNQNAFFFKSTSRRAVAEVNAGLADRGYRHHFECPSEVLDQLLTRLLHTDTQQLIFEPFGCTAPATVSAIRNGWDWIYTELETENFERGLERIEAAANEKKKSILFPTTRQSL